MSEIHPVIDAFGITGPGPSPRTVLFWDGTQWCPARVDAGWRLQVRGEDQLHSYKEPLADRSSGIVSDADGSFSSNQPAAGLVWHVTHVAATDITSPTTRMYMSLYGGANPIRLFDETVAIAAAEYKFHPCDLWLETGYTIAVTFTGSLVGDTCRVELAGEVFTKET